MITKGLGQKKAKFLNLFFDNSKMKAWVLVVTSVWAVNDLATVDRACSVFCSGPILAAVQTANPPLFNDSKTFVDMPLRVDPEDALAAFDALPTLNGAVSRDDLVDFVDTYFVAAGSDLVAASPSDWVASPPRLAKIANDTWREFGLALNNIWPDLYRVVNASVFAEPQRYSLLLREAGLVLPGGRFRETYYWDSYWIVRGLLVCGMVDTAQGVVQNLLDDVSDFGFVPNGGRAYYTQRSQPPLLASMVVEVVRAIATRGEGHTDSGVTGTTAGATPSTEPDKFAGIASCNLVAAAAISEQSLPLLEAELKFWRDNRSAPACGGLNRYWSNVSTPRPESYREDLNTAQQCSAGGAKSIFAELAAGAESGWDFSTRWIEPCSDSDNYHNSNNNSDKATSEPPPQHPCASGEEWPLAAIRARHVVPADLNAFLLRAELSVAWLHVWVQRIAAVNAAARTVDAVDTAPTAAATANASANADAAYTKTRHEAIAWLAVDERSLLSWNDLPPASTSQASGAASKSAAAAGKVASSWLAAGQRRKEAMTSLLWQPKEGRWLDALIYENDDEKSTHSSSDGDNSSSNGDSGTTTTGSGRSSGSDSSGTFLSEPQCTPVAIGSPADATPLSGWAAPLWAGLGRGLQVDIQSAIVANLTASGLLQIGGALTTRHGGGSNCSDSGTCGQQWDAPNAWAPLQALLIHGLKELDSASGGPQLAQSLADRWLESNWLGWQNSSMMYEKYDAFTPGLYGGGGEYAPQAGFGWTNGVALELIEARHGSASPSLSLP